MVTVMPGLPRQRSATVATQMLSRRRVRLSAERCETSRRAFGDAGGRDWGSAGCVAETAQHHQPHRSTRRRISSASCTASGARTAVASPSTRTLPRGRTTPGSPDVRLAVDALAGLRAAGNRRSTAGRWHCPDVARAAVESGIVVQISDTTICRRLSTTRSRPGGEAHLVEARHVRADTRRSVRLLLNSRTRAARRSAKEGRKRMPVPPINRRTAAIPMSRQDATRARTLRGRKKTMTAPTKGASRIAPPTNFGPVNRSHRSKPATTVTVQATAKTTSRSGGEGGRACFGFSPTTVHLLPVWPASPVDSQVQMASQPQGTTPSVRLQLRRGPGSAMNRARSVYSGCGGIRLEK